jgi:hypothetical protein
MVLLIMTLGGQKVPEKMWEGEKNFCVSKDGSEPQALSVMTYGHDCSAQGTAYARPKGGVKLEWR